MATAMIVALFAVNLSGVAATGTTDSSWEDVTYDSSITFSAVLNDDGSVTATWSPYSHTEEFTYYKLVRSETNNNPVYPEDGYIFYGSGVGETSYTDYEVPDGTSYYRICQIASPARYCSSTVVEISANGASVTVEQAEDEIVAEEEEVVQTEEITETDSTDENSTSEEITPVENGVFSDLPVDHWAGDCVEQLLAEGIVSGDPAGTFRPNDNVNRAEFVKMIMRALYPEMSDYAAVSCYGDVKSSDWFASPVCAAGSINIVKGYDGNVFRPAQFMTRAEAISVLAKAMNLPISANVASMFPDVTAVWQISYINAAAKQNLVGGYTDGSFRPNNNLSRAEAAKLVCNAVNSDYQYSPLNYTGDPADLPVSELPEEEEPETTETTDTTTQPPPVQTDAIIVDHTSTDLSKIPSEYIEAAKDMFAIAYGHTSHGSQITTGMEGLKGESGSTYYFTSSGVGGLLYNESLLYGDLGSEGSTDWYDATREMLDSNSHINMVMWSWCGGVSDMTSTGIDRYLSYMNNLETEYPDVTFVYMTGHLDGSGEEGNLHQRNEQIRNYVRANNKVLFDFADIESYDPSGNYFLDRYALDSNEYDSNGDGNPWGDANWADQWCSANSGSPLCAANSCAHSTSLNCNLKGRAFWWMMARLAGWDGQ